MLREAVKKIPRLTACGKRAAEKKRSNQPAETSGADALLLQLCAG